MLMPNVTRDFPSLTILATRHPICQNNVFIFLLLVLFECKHVTECTMAYSSLMLIIGCNSKMANAWSGRLFAMKQAALGRPSLEAVQVWAILPPSPRLRSHSLSSMKGRGRAPTVRIESARPVEHA